MLEPTYIKNLGDLLKIAEEMKMHARKDPVDKAVEYSSSEEEATENARRPEVVEYCKQSPCIRLLVLPGSYLVTLGFSIDQHKDPVCWTLSMSNPQPPVDGKPNIGRVSDSMAKLIATAFFDEKYEEVPPEGAYKTVRQFESEI